MPLLYKVEAFLSVLEWTAGADNSLVHTLLDDDLFRTSVTHLLLFLTAGTILAVINSAQTLRITLLKMDPIKWKINRSHRVSALCNLHSITDSWGQSQQQKPEQETWQELCSFVHDLFLLKVSRFSQKGRQGKGMLQALVIFILLSSVFPGHCNFIPWVIILFPAPITNLRTCR